MALWRDGGFADDNWTHARRCRADARARRDRRVVRALASARSAALATRADPVGVDDRGRQGRGQSSSPRRAAGRWSRSKFAKFADGRAFSYAELLRERHGFKGELRATGDVLIDEIALMLRCGFTSFEVVDANTLRALKEGRLPKGALFYQPAPGQREAPAGTRPWLRRAAS